MIEIKSCPMCWGEKVVCVGLKDNLEPITKPCSGCEGTGWIAYESYKAVPLNKPKQTEEK